MIINAVIIHYVNSPKFQSFLFVQSPYFTTWLPTTCQKKKNIKNKQLNLREYDIIRIIIIN